MGSFLVAYKLCLLCWSFCFNGVSTSLSPGEVDLYIDSFDLLLNLARSDLHIIKELLQGRKLLIEKKSGQVPAQVNEYIEDFIRGARVNKEELLLLLHTSEKWIEETVEEIAKNPISTYRLLHRYAHALPTLLASQLDPAFARAKKAVISSDLKWPDSTDLEFAADGILHLQLTYGVNSTQVSKGKFPGRDLGAQLDLKHCYDLGDHAIYLDYHSQAVEWLELALEKSMAGGPDSNQVQKVEIQRMLKMAIKAHNYAYKKSSGLNTMIFNQRLPLEPQKDENPSKIQRVSRRNSLYEKHSGSRKFKKHMDINLWGLCMGENYQTEEEKCHLFCWYEYKSHPKFTIGPLKMEFLAQDPDIVIAYNFIGDEAIKKIHEAQRDESTYYRFASWESELVFFKRGTGVAHWVWDGLGSSFDLLSITKNVEAAFNLRAQRSEESEKLYVKSYTWASTSRAHTDEEFVASAMHYLMDVEHGGYTAFPLIGLSVKPVKGAVVHWFNQKRDQTQDNLSTHLSCPVLYGQKQVATKWIKKDANIFTFNCAREKGQHFHVKVNGKEYKRKLRIS